jgi:nucleotide-binding universal stress UspA family protein
VKVYERILVALDGSELAERSLPHAEALAERFGAELTLVRAVVLSPVRAAGAVVIAPAGPGPLIDPTPHQEAERLDALDYLERLADQIRGRGFRIQTEVRAGAAAHVIAGLADELAVGLVVMTSHGRSGLERAILGSVTDEVLRHAPCPVLVVPARSA